MKIKYPIEAFALAMIVFSCHVQEALFAGIFIIILTIIGMLMEDLLMKHLPTWSVYASIAILLSAIEYALVHIVLRGVLKIDVSTTFMILHIVIALLVTKHVVVDDSSDYDRHLLESAVAYGFFLLISFIREFISVGQIYGYQIADYTFMTKGFQGVAFGLLFTGITLAIINGIFNYKVDRNISVLTVVPIVLAEQPFTVRNVPDSVSFAIAVVLTMVMYMSICDLLQFSPTDKKWKNMPIELVSLSIIYLSLIAL